MQETEDTNFTDLTVDLYRSHLDLSCLNIQMSSCLLAKIANVLYQNRTRLAVSSQDPLIELLEGIAEGADQPFSDELVEWCINKPCLINLKLNPRFLLNPDDRVVVFDQMSRVPIPQKLSPWGQVAQEDGQAVVSVIHRYGQPHPDSPEAIFEKILRSVKVPIKGTSFAELKKELQALKAYYSEELHPPDYILAGLMEQGILKLNNDISLSSTGEEELLSKITNNLVARAQHVKYLNTLERESTSLELGRSIYMEEVKKRQKMMKMMFENAIKREIETNIEKRARRERVILYFKQIHLTKKQGLSPDNLPEGCTLNPVSTETLPKLMKQGVVSDISENLQPVMKEISITFQAGVNNTWLVTMNHKAKGLLRNLITFEINAPTFVEMSRAATNATKSFGNGMITFNQLNLVHFLNKSSTNV